MLKCSYGAFVREIKAVDLIYTTIGNCYNLQVIEAGANALVAGSAVFGAKDYAEGMHHTYNSNSIRKI